MVKEYRRPGFRSVTPGLSVSGSTALLTFLERAFDARTGEVHKNDDGSVGHGEILHRRLADRDQRSPTASGRPARVRFISMCPIPMPYMSELLPRARVAHGAGERALRRPAAVSGMQPATTGSSPRVLKARPFPTASTRSRHTSSRVARSGHGIGSLGVRCDRAHARACGERQGDACRDADSRLDGRVLRRQRPMAAAAVQPPRLCRPTWTRRIGRLSMPARLRFTRRRISRMAIANAGVTDSGGNHWFIATYEGS